MPIGIDDALIAGTSMAGGLLSNAQGAHQQFKNRDLVRQLSKTQYQRAVADMRKAGLNPALAYQQGGNSAGGSGGSSQFENLGARGVQALQASEQLRLLKAQTLDVTTAAKLKDKQAEQVGQDMMIQLADWHGKNPSKIVNGELVVDNTQWGALQMKEAQQRIAESVARVEGISASAAESRARTALADIETQVKKLGIPFAQAWHDYWKKLGVTGAYIEVGGKLFTQVAGSLGLGAIGRGLLKGGATAKDVRAEEPVKSPAENYFNNQSDAWR